MFQILTLMFSYAFGFVDGTVGQEVTLMKIRAVRLDDYDDVYALWMSSWLAGIHLPYGYPSAVPEAGNRKSAGQCCATGTKAMRHPHSRADRFRQKRKWKSILGKLRFYCQRRFKEPETVGSSLPEKV